MSIDELKRMVSTALDLFVGNESYLLIHNVHERTFAAQFSCYLKMGSRNIPDFRWSIDCEYDKNIDFPKALFINGEHVRVIPDIIIHIRGENNNNYNNDNNLLVIEIKKNSSAPNREYDLLKIEGFIKQPPYYYKYGLFINFIGTRYELNWFIRED